MHKQVLRASFDRPDALPGQLRAQRARDRPAQAWLADIERDDALADQVWRKAASRGFDFGQFGHGGLVVIVTARWAQPRSLLSLLSA
jgi:hypothetical protein